MASDYHGRPTAASADAAPPGKLLSKGLRYGGLHFLPHSLKKPLAARCPIWGKSTGGAPANRSILITQVGNVRFFASSPRLGKVMFLVDQLVDGIIQWIDAPLVRQSAGEVARECRDALWRHVSGRIRGMTVAQARGYLRAWRPVRRWRGRCRLEPPTRQPRYPLPGRCPGRRRGARPARGRHPLRRTAAPGGFAGGLTDTSHESHPLRDRVPLLHGSRAPAVP